MSKSNILSNILFLILLININSSFGVQVKELLDQGKITATISNYELNRIRVINDRILEVFGLEDDLFIETDETIGQIFIKVMGNKKKVSLTIITENQDTIDLSLLAKDMPSETVLIKTKPKSNNQVKTGKSPPLPNRLIELMTAMCKGHEITSYSKVAVLKEISLWDGIKIVQIAEYQGADFTGEVYKVENKLKQGIYLTETQFGWEQTIAAVAIEKHALAKGDSTLLYIIRRLV